MTRDDRHGFYMGQSLNLSAQATVEGLVSRMLLDISELDSRVQDEVAKHGGLKNFQIVLWRQQPDASGSNWNARIEQTKGSSLETVSWWDVVPQMRERYNLR